MHGRGGVLHFEVKNISFFLFPQETAILLFMIQYAVLRGIFPHVSPDMLLLSAVYIWAEGARYEGEYKEDKKNGRGVQTWPSGARCGPHPVASLAYKTGCECPG